MLTQVGLKSFRLFAPGRTTVRIICPGNATSERVLGVQEFNLAYGCSLSTDANFATLEPTIRVDGDIFQHVVSWNVSEFIFNQEELAGIKNIPEASLKKSQQLAELLARVPGARREESPGWNHYVHTPAMVWLIAITITMVVFFGVLAYKKRQHDRSARKKEPDGSEQFELK